MCQALFWCFMYCINMYYLIYKYVLLNITYLIYKYVLLIYKSPIYKGETRNGKKFSIFPSFSQLVNQRWNLTQDIWHVSPCSKPYTLRFLIVVKYIQWPRNSKYFHIYYSCLGIGIYLTLYSADLHFMSGSGSKSKYKTNTAENQNCS